MNKYMKLGDIATFMNGYAFKPADWEEQGLPIIRIQNLTSDNKNFNYYNKNYDPKYEINKGDVLISWSASLGVYEWQGEKALLNQHIFKVVFDKIEVDKRFFIYAVKILLKNIENNLHGSTMKHITKPMFENLKFPVLSLEKQRKIADVLDCVSDILSMKKSQLNNVNKLTKFQFLKMFGDPVTNSKNQKLILLENCISKKSDLVDGPFGSSINTKVDYTDTGDIPVIRTKNVDFMTFNPKDLKFITKEKYEQIKRSQILPGDIILTKVGTIGNVCIFPNIFSEGVLSTTGSCRIRVAAHKINNIFLGYYLLYYKEKLLKIASTGVQPFLNMTHIKNIQVFNIEIELQNKFADFVRQTEKCLFELQKSIDETQLLFDSLMDKYFS